MTIKKIIKQIFQTEQPKKEEEIKPKYEREYRELLREDLNTIAVDVFHLDDPLVLLNPSERREYLLYFHTLFLDKKVTKRLEYFINKQSQMILFNGKEGELDTAGIMKMDGMSTFKDDVERLSKMFVVEEAEHRPQTVPTSESLRL